MGWSSTVALSQPQSHPYLQAQFPPTILAISQIPITQPKITQIKPSKLVSIHSLSCSSTKSFSVLQKSLPLAASALVLLSSFPAKAGLMSGFSGIESIPTPQLPQIDFLNRINEANQKKYAEADARFKESPLLKELLERSKKNEEKNKQRIQDKYCLRGAEWGVGDCSADGMSEEDKENFISMLKKKSGVEE